MSRKLSRLLSALIAAVLVVSFLPFKSLVKADTGNVYYFYKYMQGYDDDYLDKTLIYDVNVDGLSTSIPQGATRLGVYVDGGSYTASADDRFIYLNNATVNVSNNPLFNSFKEDRIEYGLAGKSKLITDNAIVTSDTDAFEGNADLEELYDHFGYTERIYDYEFTSDFVLNGDLNANSVIIDQGTTFSIERFKDTTDWGYEHKSSSELFVNDNIIIKGNLKFGEMGDVISGENTLWVEEGTITIANGGEIIPANGACIISSSHPGIDFYKKTENGNELTDAHIAYYCADEGKWFNGFKSGYCTVAYDEFSYEWGCVPEATVKMNGKAILPYSNIPFVANEKLSFTLSPSNVTADQIPVVSIVRDDEETIVLDLTKTSSGYSFSYTPNDNISFDIFVSWSEYDRIKVDDDHFMIGIDTRGSVSCSITPSGEVFTNPANSKEKKYLFEKSVLANSDLVVTITLEDGHYLTGVSLVDDYFDSVEEAMANDPAFVKVNNNVYKYTIAKDKIWPWNYVSFYADDLEDYINDCHFKTRADISAYSDGSLNGTVAVNNVVQTNEEKVYPFAVNSPVRFEITLPEYDQYGGVTPVVEVKQGNKIYSTEASGTSKINISPVSGRDYTFSCIFTPTSSVGFTANIYWSDYERIRWTEGNTLINIDSDEYNAYSFMTQPDMSASAPGNATSKRYLYYGSNIPQNGILIRLENDGHTIKSVLDYASDIYYVCDDENIEGIDNKRHFSDSDLFTVIDGKLYLKIPAESASYDFHFYYKDYENPFGVDDGKYQVIYDQKYDGDTLVAYVEANGSIVETDEIKDFEVGKEITFKLHAPANRQGLTRIVRIFDDGTFNYSNESHIGPEYRIEVINDEFKFTPTSANGFKVNIAWCEYDEFWPFADGSNFWVQTNAYDRGSIRVDNAYRSVEDPTNDHEHKYLFYRSILDNGGYAKFSFVPYANNDVACVTIDGVQYVESYNDCYPDALLMSSNPNFVKEDGIWTYRISEFDDDQVHYFIECAFTCEELPSQVVATSIALNDRIGINYYLDLPDEVANDENAYAQVNNVRYEIGAKNSDGLYPVRASVAVAEMNDELHLWICNGEGGVYTLCDKDGNDVTATGYTYSVAAYIAEAKASGNDQKLKLLLDRTNDFGKSAQDHFGYNTALGTFSYSASDISDVTSSDLNRYKSSVVVMNSDAGISSAGSSLSLDTATVIRHYFKLAPGKTINDFKFTVNADSVKTTSTGKYTLKYNSSTSEVVLSINNIAAAELQNSYRVSVSDLDHMMVLEITNFSALSYAYTVLSKAEANVSYNSRYSKLVTLMKAMYLYNRAAMQYFHVTEQDPEDDGPHDVNVGGVGDVPPEGAGDSVPGDVPPEEGTAAVTDSASAVTVPTSGTPGSGVAGVRTGEEEDASDAEQTPGQDAAPAVAGNENQEDSNDPAGTEPTSPCMDDELADSEADPGSSSSAGEQPKEEATGAGSSGEGTTAEGISSVGTSASVEKAGN